MQKKSRDKKCSRYNRIRRKIIVRSCSTKRLPVLLLKYHSQSLSNTCTGTTTTAGGRWPRKIVTNYEAKGILQLNAQGSLMLSNSLSSTCSGGLAEQKVIIQSGHKKCTAIERSTTELYLSLF